MSPLPTPLVIHLQRYYCYNKTPRKKNRFLPFTIFILTSACLPPNTSPQLSLHPSPLLPKLCHERGNMRRGNEVGNVMGLSEACVCDIARATNQFPGRNISLVYCADSWSVSLQTPGCVGAIVRVCYCECWRMWELQACYDAIINLQVGSTQSSSKLL